MSKRLRLGYKDLPSNDPVPAGNYRATIHSAEFKANRKGTGTVL